MKRRQANKIMKKLSKGLRWKQATIDSAYRKADCTQIIRAICPSLIAAGKFFHNVAAKLREILSKWVQG
jgi:hypothetical protein